MGFSACTQKKSGFPLNEEQLQQFRPGQAPPQPPIPGVMIILFDGEDSEGNGENPAAPEHKGNPTPNAKNRE